MVKAMKAKEARRRQLIEATIAVIGRQGYASTTLTQVAGEAGLSPGIVNFYFKSKEQLLAATLEHLAEEYETFWNAMIAEAGESPAAGLKAMIEADFHPAVCTLEKVAVWFAFWAEAPSQPGYRELVSNLEARYFQQTRDLVARLIAESGCRDIDAGMVAGGLNAMIDGLWFDFLIDPRDFDREAAKRTCIAFLRGLFPTAFAETPADRATSGGVIQPVDESSAAGTTNNETLPAWTYRDPEFLALEAQALFTPSWQLVCHASDLRRPGDFATLDLLDHSVFVVRGEDGALRGFHNVCRHRAARLVEGPVGHCARAVECPYHGWTYDLAGRLRAVPAERSFAHLDWDAHGLRPVEVDEVLGFVFVRFGNADSPAGAQTLNDLLAPYADELAAYRPAEMVPLGDLRVLQVPVNWKLLVGNFLEGYEVATAHPGLARLFGRYAVQASGTGVARAIGTLSRQPSPNWSERHYQKLLPPIDHLPADRHRSWCYYSLFPNLGFGVFPDMISLYQVLPVAPDLSLLRLRSYGLPSEDRALRAARFLNERINRQVLKEDMALLKGVQRGLESPSFDTGLLADTETGLRCFFDWLRDALPAARLRRPPPGGPSALRKPDKMGI